MDINKYLTHGEVGESPTDDKCSGEILDDTQETCIILKFHHMY